MRAMVRGGGGGGGGATERVHRRPAAAVTAGFVFRAHDLTRAVAFSLGRCGLPLGFVSRAAPDSSGGDAATTSEATAAQDTCLAARIIVEGSTSRQLRSGSVAWSPAGAVTLAHYERESAESARSIATPIAEAVASPGEGTGVGWWVPPPPPPSVRAAPSAPQPPPPSVFEALADLFQPAPGPLPGKDASALPRPRPGNTAAVAAATLAALRRKAGVLGQAVLDALGPAPESLSSRPDYRARLAHDYARTTGESAADILGQAPQTSVAQRAQALSDRLGAVATAAMAAVVASQPVRVDVPVSAAGVAAEVAAETTDAISSSTSRLSAGHSQLPRAVLQSGFSTMAGSATHDWVQTAFGVSLLPRDLPVIASSSASGTASIVGAGASVPAAVLHELLSTWAAFEADEAVAAVPSVMPNTENR